MRGVVAVVNNIATTSAAPRSRTGAPTVVPTGAAMSWQLGHTYVPTTVGTHVSPLSVGIPVDFNVRDRFAAKQAGPPRGVPR